MSLLRTGISNVLTVVYVDVSNKSFIYYIIGTKILKFHLSMVYLRTVALTANHNIET